jgi:subtilisin family serine protease
MQGQGTVVSVPFGSTATSNGTSFSSPLMAGLAAGFWQAFPHLTNMQVIDYLQRSGSQYDKPDSLLGFGIPSFPKAMQLVEEEMKRLEEVCSVYPNPLEANTLILYVNPAYANESLTIQYYDVTGRLINNQVLASASIKNNLFLDPFIFKSGMYIVQVSSPRINFTTKFVKL